MAENTAPITPVPPYTVRHVDGVMHLTLNDGKTQTGPLRVQPPETVVE